MEVFRVYLSAVSESDFKVIAQSDQGEAEADSKLPFFETADRWRTTLIKILEVNEFQPATFSPEEQAWMQSIGLLTSGDPSAGELRNTRFSAKLRVHLGVAIYNSLFPEGRVRQLLHRSTAQAEQKNIQLHVQICFSSNITEQSRLPDYPWELSYDPEGDRFLAQHQVVFSRYIAHLAAPPRLHPTQKLGILVVSSTASDADNGLLPLSDLEQAAMLHGLEKAQTDGLIHLEFLTPATFEQLRIALTDWMPHVLHFDGHGLFGRRCNRPTCQTMHRNLKGLGEEAPCRVCGDSLPLPQGYLLFESTTGQPHYVSARELGELIYKSSFVHTQKLALAVLSACKSGTALGGRSVFNGVAQSLIKHQVPAAIAMQYSIRADSATAFAEQFYRCLGQKQPLTIALSHGQTAMGTEDNQWYRPVLYLRWQDNEGGQLFEVDPGSPERAIDAPREQDESPSTKGWLSALMARLSPGGKRDRHILLNRVKTVWIKPLDDSRSLYQKAPIPLKLERWFLEEDGTPMPSGQPLPPQQSLLQTFDELGEGRRLLILGDAGAGKTTLLTELARALIRRAEADDRLPIPVMINLSSWQAKQPRFSDWLLQELRTGASRYGVPRRVSASWLNQDNLLLLLDGLNEVKPEFQKTCVQAINQFTQRYWRTELILCSRIADYEALEVKLNVQVAIAVLPLTSLDLTHYFDRTRHSLATLKTALHTDPVLQELAQTPLWLSIMEQVYQGDAVTEGAIASPSNAIDRRSALWDQYLLQVLPERGATPYSRRQTADWLSFLAQKMNQSQFQIEDIQPTWLGSLRQRQAYYLGVGLLAGLIIEWIYSVPVGLIAGRISLHMLDGLLPGLVIGITSSLRDQIRVFGALGWSWSWEQAKTVALPCLLLGPFIGFLVWLFGQVFNSSVGGLTLNILYGLIGGVIVSIASTFLAGLGRSGITPGIVPNQGIWRSAKRSALLTGLVLLIAAIALVKFNSYSLVFSTMLPALLGCITLYVGGLALLQHSTVRKLLFWAGKAPDNYADFLNYATQRMLIKGEGGSYRFTHNLLQEYLKSHLPQAVVLSRRRRSSVATSPSKAVLLGLSILLVSGILPPLAIDSYRASPVLAQMASPRIQQDDRLLVDKTSYHFTSLRRGDIISFKPTLEMQRKGFPYLQDFKQIAGLPGEQIEIRDGKIYVNCDRPTVDTCEALTWQDSVYSDLNNSSMVEIPQDTYLAISIHSGQNETTHFVGGLIPKANITGRIWFRFYPFHQIGRV